MSRNRHGWLCLLLLVGCLARQASSRSTDISWLHPETHDARQRRGSNREGTSPRHLLVEGDTFCELPIAVDDSFKQVYTVGVLAIRGIKEAYQEFNATFADYLTETAGKRFDPPIRFEMKVLDFITLFSDAQSKGVDFIYLNPSAYSCIDSEYEAPSLVSQVSRRNVGGNVYDLKKFGGVIAALADRDDIRSILDLKDKVVAAASISGSGSGQMQFKRMVDNGMNYLQDPKQLVFTSDQALVVEGIMNGDFDVGFVRTDQLERTVDGAGNPVDSAIFKIVAPVKNLTIDGVPFPFESSTELYPEWNVAALTHVNPTVGREVQRALLLTAEYGAVGKALSECEALNGTDVCRSLDLSEIYSGPLSCSATHDIVAAAYLAQTTGKYAGWTTSLSYMQLRSMQEATGFISMDSDSLVWRCVRDAELYDAISCPAGYNLKSKAEVDAGCTAIGLECKEGYQCICRPCEAPFELLCVDSVKVGDSCISLAIFLPSIIVPVLLIVALVVHFYLEWKRRQADSLWVIMPSELKFESPPTVIGQGTFGLVLLAEYRGTEVAVKRVIPASAHTIGYATLFDVTTNNGDSRSISRSFVQALDPEYGTLSMHPGLKPMDPRKLGTRLQIQVEHAAMEEPEQTRWKMFMGLMSCKHAERDIRDVLKVEFVNEIRQLARLRHPCITTVMGAVMPTQHDEPMLVMEYMRYGSLYDVLQDDAIQFKPGQILSILQDVAHGLRFLHSATPQVIHGDLKAQNVLIDSNFCAKVTDFGLSGKKQIGAVGTPYWMSPEILSGEGVNSAASDIYAFGMVMYEIYSGRSPYAGEVYEEVVQDICNPFIRKRPPIPLHCPPRIAKLMSESLEHEPAARPSAEHVDLSLKVELKVVQRTSRLEALNKDLELANERIAAASAMQLQHFACMSHEIRTPLNCIIGLSSLMEESDLNPMQKESMEMIISSGKLLRQIVDDVLDYSKLESGNAQVLFENINLQETLNTVVHLIQTTRVTVEKKLRIVTTYDPVLPEWIHSDSRRIQQVLYNLLGNAIKFSKPEGRVEFGVKVLSEDDRIRLTVKDFGKGIDAKDYSTIFEPFRQTETGLSNAAGGTGLGLAITQKLVEAMHGNIQVHSELGHWTEFTVDFPFGEQSKAANPRALASKLQMAVVLFVADDTDADTQRVIDVFQYFRIKFYHYNSMNELNNALGLNDGAFATGARAFVCLAHEDLCDVETCELMTARHPACLTTYGPKFCIQSLTKKHWRSLVETFPSVLIDKLGIFANELLTVNGKDRSSKIVSNSLPHSRFAELRVLIAEDNMVNQKVFSRILNRLGVTAIGFANDGREAVKKEAEEAYDIVFMDLQMPGIDGIEACQLINNRKVEEGDHPHAKVIFVTAHVSESFRQTTIEYGAIGYLPKPCTLSGVDEVLRNAQATGDISVTPLQASWDSTAAPPIHSLIGGSYRH